MDDPRDPETGHEVNPDRAWRQSTRRTLIAQMGQGIIGLAGWFLIVQAGSVRAGHPALRPVASSDPSNRLTECVCECACPCSCTCNDGPICPAECEGCACDCTLPCDAFGNQAGHAFGAQEATATNNPYNQWRGGPGTQRYSNSVSSHSEELHEANRQNISGAVKEGGGELSPKDDRIIIPAATRRRS